MTDTEIVPEGILSRDEVLVLDPITPRASIERVMLGPGTLYVDGQPVGTASDVVLTFEADR